MPVKHHIYALVDPRKPEQIRYIGQTKTPNTRHIQHCIQAGHTMKHEWLELMRADGVLPQMVIIESFEIGSACLRERHWIKYYQDNGHVLTNVHKEDKSPRRPKPKSAIPPIKSSAQMAERAWEQLAICPDIEEAAKELKISVAELFHCVGYHSAEEIYVRLAALNTDDSILALQLGLHSHWKQVKAAA